MAASLLSLPVELFENILVHTLASENFPSGQAIASLSQTCRYFYNVVYHPDNGHLWYSLFLVVWDDPSHAVEWKSRRVWDGLGNNTESGIDWKEAFIERMDARRTFGALSSETRRVPRQETIKALRAVLEALSTVSPGDFHTDVLPSKIAVHLSKNSEWISSVVLSRLNGASTSGKRMFYPRRLLLDHILSGADHGHGQPTSGTRSFEPVRFWNRKVDKRRREEEMEAQLLSRLIFLMGSGPISTSYPPLKPKLSPSSGGDSPGEPGDPSSVAGDDVTESGTPQSLAVEGVDRPISLESDYDRALQHARVRVYDMRYLLNERSWGPFQVHDVYKEKVEIREGKRRERERESRAREERARGGRARDWMVAIVIYIFVLMDGERGRREAEAEEVVELGEAAFNEPAEDVPESESGTTSSDRLSEGKAPFTTSRPVVKPGPHQFEPDFQYLAACRIVIEGDLCKRKSVGDFVVPITGVGMPEPGDPLTVLNEGEVAIKLVDDVSGEDQQIYLSLEMLRAGSAPGYQRIFLPPGEGGIAGGLRVGEKGKGKMKETGGDDRVDGWDWAGVEGEWRRLICALVYQDLLEFNMQREDPPYPVSSHRMRETVRMIRMNLKITHYTSPPPRPSSRISPSSELAYQLPVIHFKATCPGPDIRRSGSVRMCEGGWIRWSLCTRYPDDDQPKWVSENIQIGGVGSAMGFIGVWTCARHARIHPLGPCWAWKIN